MIEQPPIQEQRRLKPPPHFPELPTGVTLSSVPRSLDKRRGVNRYIIGSAEQRFEVEIDVRTVSRERLARFESEARFSLLATPSENKAVFQLWTIVTDTVREVSADAALSAGYAVDQRVAKEPAVTARAVLVDAGVDPDRVVHRSLAKIHDAVQGGTPTIVGGEGLSIDGLGHYVRALLRRPGLLAGRWLDGPRPMEARPGLIDVRLRWALTKDVAKDLPRLWEVYCAVDPWAGPGLADMFTPRTGSGPTRCWLSARDWWQVPGAWLQAIFDNWNVVGYPVGSGTSQSGVDATSLSVTGVADWVQYEWYGWWAQTVDDGVALD